jgi:hypothetical protein
MAGAFFSVCLFGEGFAEVTHCSLSPRPNPEAAMGNSNANEEAVAEIIV